VNLRRDHYRKHINRSDEGEGERGEMSLSLFLLSFLNKQTYMTKKTGKPEVGMMRDLT